MKNIKLNGYIKLHDYIYKILFVIVILSSTFIFWKISRYPALDDKVYALNRIANDGQLSFDSLIKAKTEYGQIFKVLIYFFNWVYTNWKGMLFAIFLSSLFRFYFNNFSFKNKGRLVSFLSGVGIGIPMGLCVNCAAPVALTLYRSGKNPFLAKGFMHTSPTLNIFSFTLLFSFFPFSFVAFRLAAYLIFMTAIYIYASFFYQPVNNFKVLKDEPNNCRKKNDFIGKEKYFNSLWYVFSRYVPLMFVAGGVGTLVNYFVPIQNFNPTYLSYLFYSTVAVILPTPMTFDIFYANTLMKSGGDTGFILAMLIGLGSYSIYPFILEWKYFSRKFAIFTMILLIIVSCITGIAYSYYSKNKLKNMKESIDMYSTKSYRNLYKSILDLCSKNEQYEKDCIKSIIFNRSSYKLCSFLDDEMEKNACFDNHFYESSKSKISKKDCDKIKHIPIKKKCYLDYAQVKAVVTQNLEYCNEINWNDVKEECFLVSISRLLTKKSQRIRSGFLKELDYKYDYSLYQYYQLLADETKKKKCGKLKKNVYKQECISFNVISHLSSGTMNSGFCNNFESMLKDNCQYEFYHALAKKHLNPDLCGQIEDRHLSKECLGKYYLWLSYKYDDDSYCNNINNLYDKDTCYKGIYINSASREFMNRQFPFNNQGNMNSTSTLTSNSNKFKNIPFNNEHKNSYKFNNYEVEVYDYNKTVVRSSGFNAVEGGKLGANYQNSFTALSAFEPFSYQNGITSCFLNSDLRPDILIPNGDVLVSFLSDINNVYVKKIIKIPELKNKKILFAACPDLNNDGIQDLFISVFKSKNIIAYRKRITDYDYETYILPGEKTITNSASFADVDKDGDIDIYLGNWHFSDTKNDTTDKKMKQNKLYLNHLNRFEEIILEGDLPGETFSTNLSDLNNDLFPDLLVGNDFEVPDSILYGKKEFPYFKLAGSDGIINVKKTSRHTMSYQTGDINNDGHIDIFSTDMSRQDEMMVEKSEYCSKISNDELRRKCRDSIKVDSLYRKLDFEACKKLRDERFVRECMFSIYLYLISFYKIKLDCSIVTTWGPGEKEFCESYTELNYSKSKAFLNYNDENYPEQEMKNFLLLSDGNGSFEDYGQEYGVNNSNWSWNSSLYDYDNDGYLDIYVGSGYFMMNNHAINPFFISNQGKNFIIGNEKYGLSDNFQTSSFLSIDFDLNGTVDLVSYGKFAPLYFYKNKAQHNSISIHLRDLSKKGNYFGIGAKISIWDSNNGTQMREINYNGGFQSYNIPYAHFGLGNFNYIDKLKVTWNDGQAIIINKKFEANNFYIIKRYY